MLQTPILLSIATVISWMRGGSCANRDCNSQGCGGIRLLHATENKYLYNAKSRSTEQQTVILQIPETPKYPSFHQETFVRFRNRQPEKAVSHLPVPLQFRPEVNTEGSFPRQRPGAIPWSTTSLKQLRRSCIKHYGSHEPDPDVAAGGGAVSLTIPFPHVY